MEKLLPYFERELGVLRDACREFSRRYPLLASDLTLTGEASADPHIEHLIQSSQGSLYENMMEAKEIVIYVPSGVFNRLKLELFGICA